MQSESGSAHMPGQFYVVSAASRTTDVSSGADARHVCPRHVGFVVTAAFLSDKDVAHDTVVGATEGPVNTRSSSGSGSYDGLERIAMCGSWPRLSAAPICLRKPKSAPDKAGRTTGRHADEAFSRVAQIAPQSFFPMQCNRSAMRFSHQIPARPTSTQMGGRSVWPNAYNACPYQRAVNLSVSHRLMQPWPHPPVTASVKYDSLHCEQHEAGEQSLAEIWKMSGINLPNAASGRHDPRTPHGHYSDMSSCDSMRHQCKPKAYHDVQSMPIHRRNSQRKSRVARHGLCYASTETTIELTRWSGYCTISGARAHGRSSLNLIWHESPVLEKLVDGASRGPTSLAGVFDDEVDEKSAQVPYEDIRRSTPQGGGAEQGPAQSRRSVARACEGEGRQRRG
ncbi:hypothetical protein CERSUDRAFT_122136 [Gelatoporia subvermispora B]|uniref:Uncharacterized protein n=1 Tax=Ceriporiopsis subvermispora (strain B) TaxID=914234 RepID=M2RNL5_CERS8|nr:hypothetical protein CERSUDRAFT_122136 [Gelatoporia subvermispora B]